MPTLSIIIPTHERADILARCLEHIERQTVANDLEVIVVSDGHDAKTAELFANRSWHVPLQFLEIEKSQQGTARNRGVKEAKGYYVLFIGDDILLSPNACEAHLGVYAQVESARPADGRIGRGKRKAPSEDAEVNHLPLTTYHSRVAVLGHTTWDPALEITPIMKWLEESGWQFGYPKIAKYAHVFLHKTIQANFTYTSNISLPTAIARQHPFREDLTLYGWEDVEWGMRLRDAGVGLFYEPSARALHRHTLTTEESLKRMETLGRSLVHMTHTVPEMKSKLTKIRLLILALLSLLPTMNGLHCRAFLRGIREGTKNQ